MEALGSMMIPNPFTTIKHSAVTFKDVIGHKEAKKALESVLNPFNKALANLGEGSSHSRTTAVMLYGPPGTGKTELARATAGEFSGTIIEANAAQLSNQYQGSGATNTNRLQRLIQNASSDTVVVFLDEIDAVGSRNQNGGMGREDQKTLNSLLTTIQGAGGDFNKDVLFLVATNRPDDLDPALLSRFERKIKIDAPNQKDRKNIWKLHLKKGGIKTKKAVRLEEIAKQTKGRVGRDILYMVKGLKNQLIHDIPTKKKKAIAQDPLRLANYQLKANQDDLLESVRRYDVEHGETEGSSLQENIGFVPRDKK